MQRWQLWQQVVRPRWGEFKAGWRTPANLLSLSRVVGAPVFAATWLLGAKWTALILFSGLMITDALDGYVAKKWGEVTKLGQWLDPLCDKILMAVAWTLVWVPVIGWPLVLARLIIEGLLVWTSGAYELFTLQNQAWLLRRSPAERAKTSALKQSNIFGKAKTILDTIAATVLMYWLAVPPKLSIIWPWYGAFVFVLILAILSLREHRRQLARLQIMRFK